MAAISTWSTTAASNNSAPPDGAPEGWAPSEVNAWGREIMASLRTQHEQAEWIDLGHTITFISATQFSTAAGDGDTTGVYQVGRRVRETGSLGGPFYGRVTASSHSSVTTVTVVWDSGALDSSVTAIAHGASSVTNPSIDITAVKRGQQDVITTRGDIIRGSSGAAAERLALGTSGQVVRSDGTDAAWAWHGNIQTVNSSTGAVATGTTTMVADDSIPQNTEGDQYLSLAITPKDTGHNLVIEATLMLSHTSAGQMVAALFQDSTANALATTAARLETASGVIMLTLRHYMAAGTTSATTFTVRAGSTAGGTTTLNGASSSRLFGGVASSSITISEVL